MQLSWTFTSWITFKHLIISQDATVCSVSITLTIIVPVSDSSSGLSAPPVSLAPYFAHASLDAHLEQLLSCILQPRTQRPRQRQSCLGPASPSAAFPPVCRSEPQPDRAWMVCSSECLNESEYAWIRPLQPNLHLRFFKITALSIKYSKVVSDTTQDRVDLVNEQTLTLLF